MVERDPRIGVSHISLFCALLQEHANVEDDSISLKSGQIMKSAKIAGLATYHKCIRELHEYGYIRYLPSFNHRRKSKVYLKF